MAEQVGKFLTELPELETPTDGDLMYIVDDETTSKKVTMANLKRVLGGNVTGTVEGASVSFSDGADGIPMEECEATIVPTQDLHGYSKPWAGGAGKNKYIESPSFDEYANINTYQVSGETYQGHEVIYKSTPWQGVYKANIPLNAGITYTFSAMVKMSTTASVRIYMENSTLVANVEVGTTWQRVSAQITPSTDIADARIRVESVTGDITIYLSEYQIEEGSSATTYEPYSNICPISGHTDVTVTVASTSGGSGDDTTVSLGRTVYGGTLDVTTGELIVTHGIVDLGTLNWIKQTDTSNYVVFTQANPVLSRAYNYNFICTQYATAQKTRQELLNGEIGTSNAALTNICIRDDSKEDMTETQFKTAMDGVMLVYELATPQTFTLTKEQIQTLLGQNYVSHDGGGNIKVVYIRDLDIVINDLINRVTALENE